MDPKMRTGVAPEVTPRKSYRTNGAFWEGLWRTAGLQFVGLAVLAYMIYGHQPQIAASADNVRSFFEAHRLRILVGAALSGLAILNLMWFAAAVRTALVELGQPGWGSAATASSAATAATLLLFIALPAGLAHSIAGVGDPGLTSGLNNLSWSFLVLSSFPRAMLVMSMAFGLWRAQKISNAFFGAGVAALVLILLGGTTWAGSGFWAPDGAYSRFISPSIGIVWIVAVSRVLLTRTPATRVGF